MTKIRIKPPKSKELLDKTQKKDHPPKARLAKIAQINPKSPLYFHTSCGMCGEQIKLVTNDITGQAYVNEIKFILNSTTNTGEILDQAVTAEAFYCDKCYKKIREFINKEKVK